MSAARGLPARRPQRSTAGQLGKAAYGSDFPYGATNGFPGAGAWESTEDLPEQPATRVDLNKLKVQTLRKYTKQYEVQGVHPTSSKEDIAKAVTEHWNALPISEETVLQNLLKASPRVAGMYSLSSIDEEELVEGHAPAAFISWDGEEEGMVEGHLPPPISSRDDLEEMVHEAFEQEIENINQAVHEAFKQERAELDLQVGQTVQEAVQEAVESAVETAVETAVENALLDRSFDIRANFNTLIALTGVILYWRGVWNLFDVWLGTDDLRGNVGSILIGMSVILLFRIFKLPLAEFW
ncbi:hypothetical protein COHA_001176 [Chlorella ohadii]|uniref:Histone deacetylase complex subunit SAP30 Sin3 binding domain-containing protein n=1 Tax=Chlorella ohadii TaxID=2649997 RepID=A0AAD5DWI7_9CHLO|nr:hypothetical protein COHA_001176 [Chlorella ohadii]